MNYDFLPLVEHSFTHGKEQILLLVTKQKKT